MSGAGVSTNGVAGERCSPSWNSRSVKDENDDRRLPPSKSLMWAGLDWPSSAEVSDGSLGGSSSSSGFLTSSLSVNPL